jgi:flagellar biogenesis protein FliO
MTATYIQMLAALIFVILLIVGAGFLMKKKQGRPGLMSVVSYHSMGPKKGVAALKIGKEVLILGVTSSDMRLLKTFKEDELDLSEGNAFQGKLEKFRQVG